MLGSAFGLAGSIGRRAVSVVHPGLSVGTCRPRIPRVALVRIRSGRRTWEAHEEDRPGDQSER